jgi:hypothetical protein
VAVTPDEDGPVNDFLLSALAGQTDDKGQDDEGRVSFPIVRGRKNGDEDTRKYQKADPEEQTAGNAAEKKDGDAWKEDEPEQKNDSVYFPEVGRFGKQGSAPVESFER